MVGLHLSESETGGMEKTSINVGEYLDPDRKAYEPLASDSWDTGSIHSAVGRYLDPDAGRQSTSEMSK